MKSRRLLLIAEELRQLAAELQRKVEANGLTKEELGNLGAVLLNASAVVAHELDFSRATYVALAGVAWRNVGQRRSN